MRLSLALIAIVSLATPVRADEPDNRLIDQVERSIVKQTNEFRKKHELEATATDAELTAAALKFAKFMARTDKYGHGADGRTPAQRAASAGYEYCVIRENIAYRTNTGEVTEDGLIEAFVQGWIDSPPHRENMLADYVTHTEVAVATDDQQTYYAVQMFGRPKSAAIKVQVRNESDSTQTLIIEANDSVDEFELPPRVRVKMTRCFPTTLKLDGESQKIKLSDSGALVVSEKGLQRDKEQ